MYVCSCVHTCQCWGYRWMWAAQQESWGILVICKVYKCSQLLSHLCLPAPISHQKQHLSCCLKCRREKISYWVVTCFWKSVRWFFFFFCFGGGGVGVCVCVWILSLDFFFYWLNVEESKWNFVIILNSAGDVVVSAFWVVTCKSHFYFIRIPGAVYKWRRTKTGRLISETSYLFIYFNNR